jgi:glucose uptake protein GlcU
MKTQHIITVFVMIVLVIVVILIEADRAKEKQEDNCENERTVFISDTIKCPETKTYVHVRVLGQQAIVMCCDKE